MPDYLRMDSVTAAQSAKRLLARHGIPASVRRDPQPDRKRGCAFALYYAGDGGKAAQLLREHGFSFEPAKTP